jgi:hypothetical protein
MFRPETYAAAREHGLMAVLNMHRTRFSELRPGDRFVAYVSRERVLDAHGEVLGEPYQEAAEVPPGWDRYTERVKVRFDQTGQRRDGRLALWGLAVVAAGIKTEPTNLLLVKGGFLKIPEDDYSWLRRVLDAGDDVVRERVVPGA